MDELSARLGCSVVSKRDLVQRSELLRSCRRPLWAGPSDIILQCMSVHDKLLSGDIL